MFTPDTLKNKSILVTGGGSGLGLSMAKGFAKCGAKIAICGRNAEKLEKAAAEIRESGAPQVATYSVDVRDYEAVGKMYEALVSELGELNGLVNNAAGNFLSASEDLSPNAFKSVLDIVLHGTFNCTQHFGNLLINSKKPGSVLSITTTYAETGSAFVLPSACAKAGVSVLTKSLAYEWATYNIRLNAIAPGPFPTEGAFSRLMPPQVEELAKKRIPAGRFGEHEELANLAVFMMSDMSTYMTGEIVTIDGGESLQGEFSYVAEMMPREQLKQVFSAMKPKK